MCSVFFMGKQFKNAPSSSTTFPLSSQSAEQAESSHARFPLRLPKTEEIQGLARYLLEETPCSEVHALAKACSAQLFIRNRSFVSARQSEKFLEVLRGLRGLVLSSVYLDVLHSLMFFGIKNNVHRAMDILDKGGPRTEIIDSQCMGVITLFVLHWMVIQKTKNRKVPWRSLSFWTKLDATTFDTLLATYGLLRLESSPQSAKSLAWWTCLMKTADSSRELTADGFLSTYASISQEQLSQCKIGNKSFVPLHDDDTLRVLAHDWTWSELISAVRTDLLDTSAVSVFKQRLKALAVLASRQEEVAVTAVQVPALVRVLINESSIASLGDVGVVASRYQYNWTRLLFANSSGTFDFSYECFQQSCDILDYMLENLEEVALDNTARYLMARIVYSNQRKIKSTPRALTPWGRQRQLAARHRHFSISTLPALRQHSLELRACYTSSTSVDFGTILEKYIEALKKADDSSACLF